MRLIWAGLAMTLGLAACDESHLTNEPELEEVDSGDDLRKKGDPLAVNGEGDYCNGAVLCVAGEGDCDYDYQCTGGAVCAVDNGPQFGFGEGTDVCVDPTCEDGIQNNGETGIDCGNAACGVCVAVDCSNQPANGTSNHCSVDCPCPATESDCDSDAECVAGTYCATDVGPEYGFPAGFDVCEGLTCTNSVQDGDETGVDCGGSCPSCTPTVLLAYSTGQAGFDRVGGIAVDAADGSYVVVGQFENTLKIGATSLVSKGGFDIYVAKFNTNGILQWAKSYGSPINDGDVDLRVSIDPINKRVAVGGMFAQTINFGGANLVATNYDGFIAVFDKNGNHFASKKYGDVGTDRITDVQYDVLGNLYASAIFTTKINLGGATFTSAGLTDVAVAKMKGALVHTWSSAYGNALAGESINDIVVDANQNLVAAGNFGGTLTLGGTTIVGKGLTDAMIVSFDTAGKVAWAKGYGGTGADVGLGVAVDALRRPVLAGYFRRTVDFGAGNVVAAGVSDKSDAFAVSHDTAGNFRWVHTFGGTEHDQALNVAADLVTNDVTIVGYISGTSLNFYPGGASAVSAGGNDAFVKKLDDTNGLAIRSERYGAALDDHAKALRILGGVGYIVGDYQSTVSFGGKSLTSSGGKDHFTMKLQLN